MAIRYSCSPRPSSQSCSLVSHCTNSPNRLRRGRQTCTSSTFSFFARCTCRMLNLSSLAASPCVISFFLVFFNATSRSLSTWVISSCPSCIPKAWGCQDDISTLLKDDILILLPQRRNLRLAANELVPV